MSTTYAENQAIQAIASSCGVVSLFFCLIVLPQLYSDRKKHFTNMLLFVLFSIISVLCLFLALGRGVITVPGLCQLQAFFIQWMAVALMFWITYMSYLIYVWIVGKQHPKRMERSIGRYVAVFLGLSLLLASILLADDGYGDNYLWCWVPPDQVAMRFFGFELLLLVAWLANGGLVAAVSRSLTRRFQKASFHDRLQQLLDSEVSIQRKLLNYLLIFSLVWSVTIAHRLAVFVTSQQPGQQPGQQGDDDKEPSSIYPLAVLEACLLPLQGALYSLYYGKGLRRYLAQRARDTVHRLGLGSGHPGLLGGLLLPQPMSLASSLAPLSVAAHVDLADLGELFVELPAGGGSYGNGSSHLQGPVPVTPTGRSSSPGPSPSHISSSSSYYESRKVSLYTTTFNLGEAPLAAVEPQLSAWILPGHDLYAIGVQECMDLPLLFAAIGQHLGAGYSGETVSLGSDNKSLGFHGFIALLVFARGEDLASGAVQINGQPPAQAVYATGTDLLLVKAANKGAAGVCLSVHDTSLAIVTCHLPSDSKGKSKLTKRNASAHAILKEVTLASEDLGFDLQLQHDHTLLLGDLNYRMVYGPADNHGGGNLLSLALAGTALSCNLAVNSLTGVAVACGIEKAAYPPLPLATSELPSPPSNRWLQRKFNLLRHASDPLHPALAEVKLIQRAKQAARNAWKAVLRLDELRAIMDDGDAFYLFSEPMPTFPPSYKRCKGQSQGDCGDYSDFDQLLTGFSNIGYQPPSPAAIAAIAPSSAALSPSSGSLDLTATEASDLPPSSLSPSRASSTASASASASASSSQPSIAAMQPPITDQSKIRPPSYTDRILLHSLAERAGRVTVQAYDLCDGMRASDHRPVSMTLLLEVNAAVVYRPQLLHNSQQGQGQIAAVATTKKEPAFELYELIVRDLAVTFVDLLFEEEEDEEETSGEEEDDDDDARSSQASQLPPAPGQLQLPVASNPLHLTGMATEEEVDEVEEEEGRLSQVQSLAPFRSPPPVIAAAAAPAIQLVRARKASQPGPALAEKQQQRAKKTVRVTSITTAITSSSSTSSQLEMADEEGTGGGEEEEVEEAKEQQTKEEEEVVAADERGGGRRGVRADRDLEAGRGQEEEQTEEEGTVDRRGGGGGGSSRGSRQGKKKSSIYLPSFIAGGGTGTRATATAAGSGNRRKSSIFALLLGGGGGGEETAGGRGAEGGAVAGRRGSSFFGSGSSFSSAASPQRNKARRSIFAVFFSSEEEEVVEEEQATAQENEEDLLRDMAQESSTAWQNSSSGAWRKRVLEAEKSRKAAKKQQGALKALPMLPLPKQVKQVKQVTKQLQRHLSTRHSKRKHQGFAERYLVHEVIIVFPLPVKDPLLSYRRAFDYASTFDSDNQPQLTGSEKRADALKSRTELTREELLRPASTFRWHNNSQRSDGQQQLDEEAGRPNQTSQVNKGELQFSTQDIFQVKGCASLELGAQALIKVVNKAGEELGSTVVCLSHLLHHDSKTLYTSLLDQIPLSAGGQKRGHISGKFSLRFLPSVLSNKQQQPSSAQT